MLCCCSQVGGRYICVVFGEGVLSNVEITSFESPFGNEVQGCRLSSPWNAVSCLPSNVTSRHRHRLVICAVLEREITLGSGV